MWEICEIEVRPPPSYQDSVHKAKWRVEHRAPSAYAMSHKVQAS